MFGWGVADLQGYALPRRHGCCPSPSTLCIKILLHCAPHADDAERHLWPKCLHLLTVLWCCVRAQPFLIGAFSNFTTPMIILGAMDLAAAVMLLCADPLQNHVCSLARVVDSVCQYPRIGVGFLLTWTGLLLLYVPTCACFRSAPTTKCCHKPSRRNDCYLKACASSCLAACMCRLQVSGPN